MTSDSFIFESIDLNPHTRSLVELWDNYGQFRCEESKTLLQRIHEEITKPVSHLLLGRSEPLPLERRQTLTIHKTAAVGTTEQMLTQVQELLHGR